MIRVLFCGDVVGPGGRKVLLELLPVLKEEFNLNFIIVNGENAAGGSGLVPSVVNELFFSGVDVITTGDHVWKKKEIFKIIDKEEFLLRPANFKRTLPGKGFCIKEKDGVKLCVINLIGRVFMNPVECPFLRVREILEEVKKITPNIIVDFHAEATSEKKALGYFLEKKVSAVIGTHTHVPTADETILSNHTAYITDVGMTGSLDSVLGREKEKVIEHFLTDLPKRFDVSNKDLGLQAVLIEIDENTGRALSIKRLERRI